MATFAHFLDRLLLGGTVALATAGCVFTFQQSYQTSSLIWSLAFLFAQCRHLIAEDA